MRHARAMTLWVATLALVFGLAAPSVTLAQDSGDIFVVAAEGEPITLTAHLAGDVPSYLVASNVFSSLVKLDYDFNPVPDLATDWEISDDGLTYTFHLEEDAVWHDGQPVTADDVVFTIEVLEEHHARRGTWLPNVEEVVALDEHTVEFHLTQPFAPLMTVLGSPVNSGALILPRHVWGDGQDVRDHPANFEPVGSGPFKFQEWVRGSHVSLVANEDYFKDGLPKLERLVVQFLPDEAARTLAFESGEVNYLHQFVVPLSELGRWRDDDRYQVIDSGAEAIGPLELLLFNLTHDQLGQQEVRQAMAYALDREAIREFGAFGEGSAAHSHVHSGLAKFHTADYDVYEPDVERANEMLDEAGLERGPDGTRFRIRLAVTPGRSYEPRVAEVVRDQLADVGIVATIETSDRTTFVDSVFVQSDFDLAIQTLTSGPDPTISVSPRYHTKQQLPQPFVNTMKYSNPELDEILDTEFAVVDEEERRDLWHRAQEILMTDLPILPLFEVPISQAVSAGFADAVTNPQSYIESREMVFAGTTDEPTGEASEEPADADADDAEPASSEGGGGSMVGILLLLVIAAAVVLGLVIRQRRSGQGA